MFASQLEKLGYFSYTSPAHREEAKSSLKNSFDTAKSIITPEQTEGRIFSCGDCEELFEEGGVPDLLEKMSTLFTALNIRMEYKNDDYTEDGHTIVVNDRTYVMAEGSILAWGGNLPQICGDDQSRARTTSSSGKDLFALL